MTDLLSPEQLDARARLRRERLSNQLSDDGATSWPTIIEGWSGDRQVFGFALKDPDDLRGTIALARSSFNADTVVVFSDSRILSVTPEDAEGRQLIQRYQRGEVTLLELARQGDPRVIDQITIVPFNMERGIFNVRMVRYLTQYAFGREVGVIWDIDSAAPAMFPEGLKGRIPDALEWGMREFALSADHQALRVKDGGTLMWEALDASRLERVAAELHQVTGGRFVILNAHPKITEAAGLAPGSAPGRIAIGNRAPDVVMQLVTREVKNQPAP